MRSILLDADCIIELFEIGKWKGFLQANSIFIPSIIFDEAEFYYDEGGWKYYIDFSEDQKNNNFNILEADVIELIDTGNMLHSVDIHKGELEAIALLRRSGQSNMFFCTGDRGAIIACCLLEVEDRCISLEKALNTCGLTSKTKKHYTKCVMKERKKRRYTKKDFAHRLVARVKSSFPDQNSLGSATGTPSRFSLSAIAYAS